MTVESFSRPINEHDTKSEGEVWTGRGVFMFPGQASQGIGIGKELYETSKAARAVFRLATKISGVDIAELCFKDPQGKLSDTLSIQLATGVVCIAAYRAALEKFPQLRTNHPIGGAGISFGEITNTIISRAVDEPEVAVPLMLARGNIMEEVGMSNPGRMAVVSRMNFEDVKEACDETGSYIALKYHNYVTIAGLNKQMDDTTRLLTERADKDKKGGRITDNVMKYPLHTPHMKDAVQPLIDTLEPIKFNDPIYPVVLNPGAEVTESGERIKERLPWGLTNPVDVVAVLGALKDLGGEVFVEFCPKPVLSPLLQRADSSISTLNLHNSQSLKDFNLSF